MNFDLKFAQEAFIGILRAVPVSFLITGVSLVAALPVGFLLGLARYKRIKVLDQMIAVVVSFLRGTPLVVQIFIVFSGFPRTLNVIGQALNWNINFFAISAYAYAFIVYSLNLSAVLSEVFRSSLAAVGKNQMEAAQSIGLTNFQSYLLIVIPQALVSAVPNICNSVLNIFKSTSLVYIMGIQDITGAAKAIGGVGYKYVEVYVVVFLIYVVLCFVLQRLFGGLENRLKFYKLPAL